MSKSHQCWTFTVKVHLSLSQVKHITMQVLIVTSMGEQPRPERCENQAKDLYTKLWNRNISEVIKVEIVGKFVKISENKYHKLVDEKGYIN